MPKLSPLQWLLLAVFLAFYGFAVFALTRDYYIRHPVRPTLPQGQATGGADMMVRLRWVERASGEEQP